MLNVDKVTLPFLAIEKRTHESASIQLYGYSDLVDVRAAAAGLGLSARVGADLAVSHL
jgi:hypothetical protein